MKKKSILPNYRKAAQTILRRLSGLQISNDQKKKKKIL
jgi:hypothetical protein